MTFDKYISQTFAAFIQRKTQVVLCLDELYENANGKIKELLVHELYRDCVGFSPIPEIVDSRLLNISDNTDFIIKLPRQNNLSGSDMVIEVKTDEIAYDVDMSWGDTIPIEQQFLFEPNELNKINLTGEQQEVVLSYTDYSNLFLPEMLVIFKNVNIVTIQTTGSNGYYYYPLSMIRLLSTIDSGSLDKVIVKAHSYYDSKKK
eukprot:319892_1